MLEPLSHRVPSPKVKMAAHVLMRFNQSRKRPPGQAKEVRRAVFRAAATVGASPHSVLDWAAQRYQTTSEAILDLLFSDLPSERPLAPPREDLSPNTLALMTNLSLAQGFVFRDVGLSVRLFGKARPVVRHAKLKGLICTIQREDDADLQLDISGPLALFRRTLVYGRSLAQLIPFLAWCDRFELRANCVLRDQAGALHLSNRDPVFPGDPPKAYDSRLERRFARDFGKVALDWMIIREPEPVQADGTLLFPDFALIHRQNAKRKWLLEVVGFWTPQYVSEKLGRLRAADLDNLILCIDEERDCADGQMPRGARVIRFKGKIDVREVLRVVNSHATTSSRIRES